MNAILERPVRQATGWPQEDQEELPAHAREIEARRTGAYAMCDDEKSAVAEGIRQADCGEFVPDGQLIEADRRHQR